MAENSEIRLRRPNFPENPPGSRMRQPSSREISRDISREVGCGSRLPGECPGESVSLDCGGLPCELISANWGISARCRRAGGLPLRCRLDPRPFRVSRGSAPALCAPESVSPQRRNSADFARRFPGIRTARFYNRGYCDPSGPGDDAVFRL